MTFHNALLVVVLMAIMPVRGIAKEAYAVYNNRVLTFYYDDLRSTRNGTIYDMNTAKNVPGWSEWSYNTLNTKKVVISPSFIDARPTSTYSWFSFGKYLNSTLSEIIGLQYLNTSDVTDMSWMFSGCELKTIDVSHFDTSNVTDMSYMFEQCLNLTTLDVSHFNTSNVTDMRYMFEFCKKLEALDVSHFDTGNVTTMQAMFYNCNTLQFLDVSHFNTSSVTNMNAMFSYCENLKRLDVANFNTSNVTDMGSMFSSCQNLIELNVSGFNTINVTNMAGMFWKCEKINSLDVSNFDTSNVDNMSSMFGDCSNLEGVDVSHFNTTNVTNMGSMFYCCNKLKKIDINGFDTRRVTNMGAMFQGCIALSNLNVSNFVTSNVLSMASMFASCSSLTELNVSNFDTSNVKYMNSMFYNCRQLAELNVSNFNTRNVTNMSGMFSRCRYLSSLDLSNFDTSSVISMEQMFYDCSCLERINISNFNTNLVSDMRYMFYKCTSLMSIDLSSFNTSSVKAMAFMFNNCNNITVLDLTNFDTGNVTDSDSNLGMRNIFNGCRNLSSIYVSNGWNTSNITSTEPMFEGCDNIVGGAGTVYDANHVGVEYAHVDGGPSNPGYLTYKEAMPLITNSDDLQDFINGLGDYIGTEEEPIVVPVSDEGLTIGNEVNINDDLQLFIDGGESVENKLPVHFGSGSINLNRQGSYLGFKNVSINSLPGMQAPISMRAEGNMGGINNKGKVMFSNSTLNEGNYIFHNLSGALLVVKENTTIGSQADIIDNSGSVIMDGTVKIGGLTNKHSGRIYVTSALTQDVNVSITDASDIETNIPIISGGEGYTLSATDASNIHLSLPTGYEWRYDSSMSSIILSTSTGILQTTKEQPTVVQTFDATGRSIDSKSNGLKIQRMSDGTVKKHYLPN